jgi:colanic acid biosynthesis glycosyl transferase WcaI
MTVARPVVLINQFYPPDSAPTGVKLHALAKALCERGERVLVLASARSYNGDQLFKGGALDGIDVIRLHATGFGRGLLVGKLFDYVTYHTSLFFRLLVLRPRPKVVVALTTPPFLGVLPALLFGRRRVPNPKRSRGSDVRVVQWIMDLYPDVIVAHGMINKGSLVYRLFASLNRLHYAHSDVVLALGPRMAQSVSAYVDTERPANVLNPGEHRKVHSVPLWADGDNVPVTEEQRKSIRDEYGWDDTAYIVMHAGNVGPGTRTDEFLAAAARTGPEGPIWAFFGGGSRWNHLESALQLTPCLPIQLRGYAPKRILHAADVHLVSLAESWTGVGVPSKLQNIFAIGRPIIFVGGTDSECAIWVRESGGGWVVRERDVDSLVRAIAEARDPAERRRRGRLALQYARQNFDLRRNCDRLATLVLGTPANRGCLTVSGAGNGTTGQAPEGTERLDGSGHPRP